MKWWNTEPNDATKRQLETGTLRRVAAMSEEFGKAYRLENVPLHRALADSVEAGARTKKDVLAYLKDRLGKKPGKRERERLEAIRDCFMGQ